MKNFDEILLKITEFVSHSNLNSAKEIGLKHIFDIPLIGVSSADDPIYERLKEPGVVGLHYLMPHEWLPEAKTVISYFLPFSEEVRKSNSTEGLPSKEWLYGRIEGETFNDALRRFLVQEFISLGEKAIAPGIDTRFSTINKKSNWSERHTAFISGLGTFGLSKSLITKKGCAGRYGSVITSMELTPTIREYKDIYEYCIFCGQCIPRCPVDAINKNGKNDLICSSYLDNDIKSRYAPRYGCGKCQTAVPCEYSIP